MNEAQAVQLSQDVADRTERANREPSLIERAVAEGIESAGDVVTDVVTNATADGLRGPIEFVTECAGNLLTGLFECFFNLFQ